MQRLKRFESVKSVESRIMKDHPSKTNAGWVSKTCVMTKDKKPKYPGKVGYYEVDEVMTTVKAGKHIHRKYVAL